MKFIYAALCVIALMVPASAQQMTPSQAAIQVGSLVNSMATALENDQKVIADLQKQVADLKTKYEPKAAPEK